ncbi:MAG: T9SS type A sorting domain-containing protein [Vicingaceae bacterium]
MKNIFFGLLITFFAFNANATGVIVLEGHYQGKNLYVQNPFAGSGVGFCTFEVTINGEVTTDEVNSSAFEIDFANFQLKVGDPVIIKIKHKDDCKPKVLNPEVLKPKSTYEIVSMSVSKDGNFDWKTKSESGKLTFIVEQFRWNKWIKIGEVDGNGASTENSYQFKITAHSGENKFRVKQIDYSGKPRYSQASRFTSVLSEISFSPIKAKTEVNFTNETLFEVYDSYGNIVKKGFGEKVDVSNLKKGIYYLNYDNKTDTFVKK